MLRLVIRTDFMRRGYGFYLVDQSRDGYRIAKPIEFEFEGDQIDGAAMLPPEPTFYLSEENFQSLRDSIIRELIGSGIETNATANAAELKATKYHLEDMRTLVMRKD